MYALRGSLRFRLGPIIQIMHLSFDIHSRRRSGQAQLFHFGLRVPLQGAMQAASRKRRWKNSRGYLQQT